MKGLGFRDERAQGLRTPGDEAAELKKPRIQNCRKEANSNKTTHEDLYANTWHSLASSLTSLAKTLILSWHRSET